MAVSYTFATATGSIPLSQLDANFATPITLGSTSLYLGNTTTSVAGLSLTTGSLAGVNFGSGTGYPLVSVTNPANNPITGTPSNTTYLRGDGVWAAVSSGGSSNGGTLVTGSVVLTSASTGAQSITATGYGQTVTLPNATTVNKSSNLYNINNTSGYPITILDNSSNILGFIYPYSAVDIGLADNSTAAGVWNIANAEIIAVTAVLYNSTVAAGYAIVEVIALDSTRELVLLNSGSTLYGVIYNSSTQTFGTPTLITSTYGRVTSAILTTTNQVLVTGSNFSTTLGAVVLTLSGTTITVGTYATITVAGTYSYATANNLIAQGTSWVLSFYVSTGSIADYVVAFTISGTTVTIGTPVALSGNTFNYVYLTSVSSSVFLTISYNSTTTYITPYSLSGTTITAGTGTTITPLSGSGVYRILPISSGARWVIAYTNSGNTATVANLISVSGTTASVSSAVTLATTTTAIGVTNTDMIVSGSKLIFFQTGVGFQILTDTAGTPSVGTFLTYTTDSTGYPFALSASNNIATFTHEPSGGAGSAYKTNINFSGSSPTISSDEVLSNIANNAGNINISWGYPSSFNGVKLASILTGTLSISVSQSTNKFGVFSTSATLAIVPKFTLPNNNVASAPYNNEMWTIGNSLYRIQSIT
jgi:hypothetical protein